MQTTTERITLYFREGSSDKVYHAAVEPSGTGFVVTFAFGRRGSTLQTGTKTPTPTDHAAAKKIFDKLVREKTAKGYTPGEDGAPYARTGKAQRTTGVLPQLLNPIDESELERFLKDDLWWMQEKFDGRRVLIRKQGNAVTGINRNGLSIALPESVAKAVLNTAAESCLLDGEAVGDTYYAFDLLELDGSDLRQHHYAVRYAAMVDVVDAVPSDALRFAESATGPHQKSMLLEKLRKQNKEGAVFKDRSAPHTPGRPASGGSQLKYKFTASASCIVDKSNGSKRSVGLVLLNGGVRVGVGNVTIPANCAIPAAGQVIEVRYLYAYAGGSLYQPVFLGVRDDIDREDCRLGQLKFKPENGGDREGE